MFVIWLALFISSKHFCHSFTFHKYISSAPFILTSSSFKKIHPDTGAPDFSWKLSSSKNDDDDNDTNDNYNYASDKNRNEFNTTILTNRIQQMKESESENSDKFTSGLHQRIQEIRSSKQMEEQLLDDSKTSYLPVICMDAMLPNQRMEGKTEDTTFIQLLLDSGLGGWFVMTSLDFRSKKIRRSGVLCKIEFVDAAKKETNHKKDDTFKFRLPTSVDFVIVGKRRCRVVGKREDLRLRIGRWRRGYDENGEEAVLGWGDERFLDLSETIPNDDTNELSHRDDSKSLTSQQWSLTQIQCNNLDPNETITQEMITKTQTLLPMIDEWYNLASNEETYYNTNVTATCRIKKNQPILSVKPDKILDLVMKELGERPSVEDPTSLSFWAAALINPLPVLGISIEIRGKMLEAANINERLNILEWGLSRSIQNLKGERPL